MAVQSATSRIQYAGNNSTSTSYAVPFVFLENSHLQAIARTSAGVESAVTLTNHTGAGDVNGGTVRTAVAVPATSTLTIFREVPATQTTTYAEGGDFPAASHERALDKLTQIAQQLKRGVENSVRLSEATPLNPIPVPSSANPHVLTTVNGGTPTWETVPSVSFPASLNSLSDATTVNAADELIIQQSGITKRATANELFNGSATVTATGSTTGRTLKDRFADVVNVKDFGAIEDGVADDSAAIASACQYAESNNKPILFSRSATLLVPSYFSTLQKAVDLTKVSSEAVAITLRVEAGHALADGVHVANGDYRHFTITSADATVTTSASFPNGRSLVYALNASAPTLGCLVDMAGRGANGYFLQSASSGRVLPYCGVRRAGSNGTAGLTGVGLFVWGASKVWADYGIFTDCDRNVWVTHASSAYVDHAELDRATGTYGVYCARSSILGCSYSSITNCHFNAVAARRARITCMVSNLSNAGMSGSGSAVWAREGSIVVLSQAAIEDELGSDCSGSMSAAADVDASILNAFATNFTNCNTTAINCRNGATVAIGRSKIGGPAAWETGRQYVVGNYVTQSSVKYFCVISHTSGTFSTDLTAGKWVVQIAQWLTSTSYTTGDRVFNNNNVYEALTGHTSGVFATDLAASRWLLLSPAWASGASYAVGNYVVRSSVAYYCAAAHTSSSSFVADASNGKWVAREKAHPRGIGANESKVVVQNAVVTQCVPNEGIRSNNSQVNCSSASITECTFGIIADDLSDVWAQSASITGSLTFGAYAIAGSRLSVQSATITGSPAGGDLRCQQASQIFAQGTNTTNGTGAPSLTDVNVAAFDTFTTNGAIWD